MENQTESYYQAILNAMPLMIFLVDQDVRIHYFNHAVAHTFGLDRVTVVNRRTGEALHCLHAQDVPEGCGRGPSCKSCVIRNSVAASLRGQGVTRKRAKIELQSDGATKQVEALITTSPMPSGDTPLVLLIIEDISEISALRDIIPICSHCRKIRDDHQYWHTVESYFNRYSGVDFTHGICPACLKQFFPDYARQKGDNESDIAK